MVKFRFESALLAALAVLLAGCASGGGAGSGGGGAIGVETARPRSDTHTNSAELHLLRATDAENPAVAYQQALTAALNGILQNPNNPLAYLQAGRAHIGLGQYLAADSMLTRAEQLYPPYLEDTVIDRENGWINLFNATLENPGDLDAGIQLLETAEVIFPRMRPEALINLGVTYGNLGRYDEAVDAYGTALEIIRGPRIEEVDSATAAGWRQRGQSVTLNQATILTIAQRFDEAAAIYSGYLESYPGDVQALNGLATALASGGQTDSAQAVYNDLLEMDGLTIRDYLNIGVGLYTAAGSVDTTVADPRPVYRRAATAFQAVADIAPQNRDAVYNLAQSLFDAQAWEALLPVSEQLMELDPYNPQTYLLRAFALDRTGEEMVAIEVYARSDSLAFTMQGSRLEPRSAGGGTLFVDLTNNTLDPGTPVELRVHFNGADGAEIGTVDVRVDAPAQGEEQRLQADLSSDVFVVGYYIEVLSPR